MSNVVEKFVDGIIRHLSTDEAIDEATTAEGGAFMVTRAGLVKAVTAELVLLAVADIAEELMAERQPEQKIEWTHAPLMDRWIAETPSGRCTVGKVRAAGHGWAWAATLADGHRIASADTAEECKESAEYHARRLARDDAAEAMRRVEGGE